MRNGRNGKIQKSYNSKYNTYKQIKGTKLKYKFVLLSFAIKNYRNYESNKITKILPTLHIQKGNVKVPRRVSPGKWVQTIAAV